MDIYAQNILDHYKNPTRKGSLSDASISNSEVNYSCGDSLEIDLRIEDDKLVDLRFRGQGCAIGLSTMSILSDEIIGMRLDDILKLSENDIHDILGIPITQRRRKCALLSLLAVKNAIRKFEKKEELKWTDLVQ